MPTSRRSWKAFQFAFKNIKPGDGVIVGMYPDISIKSMRERGACAVGGRPRLSFHGWGEDR